MFGDLALTGDLRVLLASLSSSAVLIVSTTTLKNAVWKCFTGNWFHGKPVRFVGTLASLGLLAAMWQYGPLLAGAGFLLGFAVTDGAVLLAEARRRGTRSSLSPRE